MRDDTLNFLEVDRSSFSVASSFDEADELAYWLDRSPHERLQYMEILRRINYGDAASARLQRILEVTQLTSS
jgi:hypothetical protein